MVIVISILVLVVFYSLPIKEEDAVDRIRNYGIIILSIGSLSWVGAKLFGSAQIIPRWFELNNYNNEAALQIMQYLIIGGLVQTCLGLLLKQWGKK